MKRILSAAALAAVLTVPAWADLTYRWVDESGEAFYSPTPPTDPDQAYVVLRNGLEIERWTGSERLVDPNAAKDEQRAAREAQQKADALLLVQYRNLDDIDTAMENELDNLEYDFNLLDGAFRSLRKSLFEQIAIAADRQRAGMDVVRHEREKIEALRERLSENRAARRELANHERHIRDEYAAKKERYQVLSARQAGP